MRNRSQLDLFITKPEERGPLAGPPAGPHLAALHCARCEGFRGWLPRTAHQFLIEIVEQFGRPDTPITIGRGRRP